MGEVLELERGPRYGDRFDVTIEELNAKGLGVARVSAVVGPGKQAHDYEILVHKAVPGDVVRAEVERYRRGEVTCRVAEILTPSPMRVAPECQHFGFRSEQGKGCGGCTMQGLSYRHQLMIKERLVKQHMIRAGHDPGWVLPVMEAPSPWYYRNKMEFSFGDNPHDPLALGMHPSGYRYDVLALKECRLQSEFATCLHEITAWAYEAGLKAHVRDGDGGWLLQLMVREGKHTGERLVELMTTAAPQVLFRGEEVESEGVARELCAHIQRIADAAGFEITSVYWTQHHAQRGQPTRLIEHHLAGRPTLREELHLPGDHVLSFEVHPRAFFQPNTFQAERLYGEALRAAGLLGGDNPPGVALDLYCGTGTIGLAMAPHAQQVVGVEINEEAVVNARHNAAHNGITNAQFFAGDVGDVLAREGFSSIDLVVVDPPRAGLAPQARRELAAIGAPRLVYVSCNPKALATDLVDLLAAGYRVEQIQPVDMFPHTRHIECVAALVR